MSDQSPFEPPFQPPAGPPSEPIVPVSPIAPTSSPWKPAALGFGVAAALGAGIFGVLALTGDDEPPSSAAMPGVSVPPAVQEQIDAADEQAADVLASMPSMPATPSVPAVPGSVPQGEPSDSPAAPTTVDAHSDGDVVISIPDAAELEAITECLGFGDLLGGLDLGQLGELGELPMGSIPNFEELTPEELGELDVAELLELVFGEINADLPAGSLPFDLSILEDLDLGELGETGALTPEQLQELIESQLDELGSLTSTPPVPSLPVMPSIPALDPAQLEECLADMMPAG